MTVLWWVESVAYRVFRSFDKAEPNSQFRGKCIRDSLIKIRVLLVCKLSGTPDQGATDPRPPLGLPYLIKLFF
jgi:hypothetical protein